MRRTLTILAVTVLGACSGSTVVTETSSPRASGTGAGQATARVGDTLTLHGIDEAVAVEVTVLEIVDPAKVGRFDQPSGDKHFLGVKIRLTNVGENVYSDSPAAGATLVDAADQQYDGSIFGEVKPDIGSVDITPGDTRTWFISFDVPDGTKARTFQLRLEIFGPEIGQWELS